MTSGRNNYTLGLMLLLLCFSLSITGQQDSSLIKDYQQQKLDPVEVDLLYSYYQQDGDNSPVLGGQGTEYLTDHVGQISATIPLRGQSFNILAGVDHYTSASTDNINPATVSSASVVDDRIYFSLSWLKERELGTHGLHAGFSTEWDVNSVNLGGTWSIRDEYDNHQLLLRGQVFRDLWSLIYPVELRKNPSLPKGRDVRYIFDASASWSFVINQRWQSTLTLQGIHQNGLLATPFHRVYFANETFPDIERLPRERWKFPASLRSHYYINEFLIVKGFYRYYFDDFDIRAHTAEVELPVRLNFAWSVLPFYRYHTQTAAQYFAPHGVHEVSQEYYTSDYDLSAFDSHQYGMGIRYSPIGGLWKSKFKIPYVNRNIEWKNIEIRGALYNRSDGLNAWIFSLGTKFNFN